MSVVQVAPQASLEVENRWDDSHAAGLSPDLIKIDIPARKIDVDLTEAELQARREKMLARGKDAFRPNRDRWVSPTLQAYALMATSAAMGAVRDISQLERKPG